jgi:Fur family peroxide stress response transcriptional regulator
MYSQTRLLTIKAGWYIILKSKQGKVTTPANIAERIQTAARAEETVPTKSISIQQFEAACRARGLPLTVQRRRIFEALLDRTDHPTPDEVYAAVKDTLPGVSRTTVYRVLETLVALGALAKACSPTAATRVDPRMQRHHHLVCQRCDRLFDVDDAAVEHRICPPDVRRQGFAIHAYSIYFTGLCAACQEADKGSRRPGRQARRSGRKGKTSKRTAPRP